MEGWGNRKLRNTMFQSSFLCLRSLEKDTDISFRSRMGVFYLIQLTSVLYSESVSMLMAISIKLETFNSPIQKSVSEGTRFAA